MNQNQPNAPYPGLRPYREDERNSFFGRDTESKVLIDKILVHRLTLLFAATGVGKSSMLQAAVMPHLKAPLGENLDVAYYIDWVSSPLEGLKQAVKQTLQQSGSWRPEITYTPPANEKLSDFFSFCTLFSRQPLVVVLDQFEEFFRYQRGGKVFQPFLEQLTNVITTSQLPVHVVFSMREDFALELNAFKPYMPLSLFDNFYRLEKLDKAGAKAAIVTPLEPIGYRYEPALLEQLLDDLLSRDLDREGKNPLGGVTESVEPPYLQIVCSQLWEREQGNLDKTLRLSTYQATGGAVGLVQNYIQNTLNGFTEREKYLASRAFDHLVSRHGAKMPYTAEDLAEAISANSVELRAVLEKLSRVRILRSQQREDKIWYELYHDMFSGSIDGWNGKQKEKIRNRNVLIFSSVILVTLTVAYSGMIFYFNSSSKYLRLDKQDNSRVEIYQGKLSWPDHFKQHNYLKETRFTYKQFEPDKRFYQLQSPQYDTLYIGLIQYRPSIERITGYIENGSYQNAISLTKQLLSEKRPSISREALTRAFNLKTKRAFDLMQTISSSKKQGLNNQYAKYLLRQNTLQLPLQELDKFNFFDMDIKSEKDNSIGDSVSYLEDPRLIEIINGLLESEKKDIRINAAFSLSKIKNNKASLQLIRV